MLAIRGLALSTLMAAAQLTTAKIGSFGRLIPLQADYLLSNGAPDGRFYAAR